MECSNSVGERIEVEQLLLAESETASWISLRRGCRGVVERENPLLIFDGLYSAVKRTRD